ncbi:hypothetical protein [Spiroplasma eriocheiris]|uniref:Uncharacterized protein n=1 Tax=Spiroplasma eriocheiris TaxID=315358 RepID=A0A0H3XJ50_9MOLU|nr:hypothetical protein [Spiroplasma eriocheiris]AHF57375.1 hypothetical protein SPE_0242 [Spiroplasma eriocheiris CCTCC M 207170]AKM53831.1 hypothetical protein SERIO_v1c02450 [Spiroplasma eriocheiris]
MRVKNKVKAPEELAKVISTALKICFVNFIWIFLEKIVEKYTSQQEAKRNLLFRDVNYGSEKKNDSCFKNSIANLVTNWELEFYQLNDDTLELISLAQYFQQLNQIKKQVFIKFNINFMNKKYSFVTWPVGNHDFELQDIYNILKINKIEFVNSQMLLENYYYHVFKNHSITSLENLETTYHLYSTNLVTKISLLEQNKKLTNTEKGNQMILTLNLIQLEVAYQALKQKMLLEFEFDSNVAKEG